MRPNPIRLALQPSRSERKCCRADGLRRQTARLASRPCGRETVMCDPDGWFVRRALLQAFNTETTKNHGAARSRSDDKSPQAVLYSSAWNLNIRPLMQR
jgi:hypothetical protein